MKKISGLLGVVVLLAIILAVIFGGRGNNPAPKAVDIPSKAASSGSTRPDQASTALDQAGEQMKLATDRTVEVGKTGNPVSLEGKFAVNRAALPAIEQAERERKAYYLEIKQRKLQEELQQEIEKARLDLENARKAKVVAEAEEKLCLSEISNETYYLSLKEQGSRDPRYANNPGVTASYILEIEKQKSTIEGLKTRLVKAKSEIRKCDAEITRLSRFLENPSLERITRKYSR